jgi:hypothetical protein
MPAEFLERDGFLMRRDGPGTKPYKWTGSAWERSDSAFYLEAARISEAEARAGWPEAFEVEWTAPPLVPGPTTP